MIRTIQEKLGRWRWVLVGMTVLSILSVLPLTVSAALTPAQSKALNREVAEERVIFRNRQHREAVLFFSRGPLSKRNFIGSGQRTTAQIRALKAWQRHELNAFLRHIQQERESSPFKLVFFRRPIRHFP